MPCVGCRVCHAPGSRRGGARTHCVTPIPIYDRDIEFEPHARCIQSTFFVVSACLESPTPHGDGPTNKRTYADCCAAQATLRRDLSVHTTHKPATQEVRLTSQRHVSTSSCVQIRCHSRTHILIHAHILTLTDSEGHAPDPHPHLHKHSNSFGHESTGTIMYTYGITPTSAPIM